MKSEDVMIDHDIIINVSYIMKVTKRSKKSGCPIKAKPDKCGSLD